MSGGTSLQELMALTPQYNEMQNTHYEQGHGAQDMMHQSQHAPYYSGSGAQGYPQFIQPVTQTTGMNPNPAGYPHLDVDSQELNYLANDISKNLPDNASQAETEEKSSSSITLISSTLRQLKLPMIILVAYILLSLPIVQQTLGRAFAGVNSNLVIVIYGVILSVLVMLGRRLVRRF